MMAFARFFVSNLPQNVKEKDLTKLFQNYGEIERVELKMKENLVDPENVNIIAFVTLKINESDINYCLNELKWCTLKETKIKVSLAKESFLDRLKRERLEANQKISDDAKVPKYETIAVNTSFENTKKTFGEESDLDESDIDPHLFIAKKSAAKSLSNGKIVIQSFDNNPIHIIGKKNQHLHKKLDPKSNSADQKRKQSLLKMKNQYNKNKVVIQQALSGLDTSIGRKIKFTEEENGLTKQMQTNIFGFDDEADTTEIKWKNEYCDKKTEKLVELQRKNTDSRFRMDARFLDDADNVSCKEQASEEVEKSFDPYEERNWQLDMLEQIVGTKLNTENAAQKSAKNKKMLRFDPSKDEHQKFLRQDKLPSDINYNNNLKTNYEDKNLENSVVSKDVFYEVSNTLTNSLKTKTDGFSLLNMFGKEDNLEQREKHLEKVTDKKILLSKSDVLISDPFRYDSSSASENEDQNNEVINSQKGRTANKLKKTNVTEPFFISKNDARLKGGYKFFKYEKKSEDMKSYENVRNRLKLLIKTKINKSKKSVPNLRRKFK